VPPPLPCPVGGAGRGPPVVDVQPVDPEDSPLAVVGVGLDDSTVLVVVVNLTSAWVSVPRVAGAVVARAVPALAVSGASVVSVASVPSGEEASVAAPGVVDFFSSPGGPE